MKRPEKKELGLPRKQDFHYCKINTTIGYNKACEEWERWYKETYDVPLQRLTPQGSEFVDNPERCFKYIKERITDGHEARKNLVRFKKSLPSEEEIYTIIVDGFEQTNSMIPNGMRKLAKAIYKRQRGE